MFSNIIPSFNSIYIPVIPANILFCGEPFGSEEDLRYLFQEVLGTGKVKRVDIITRPKGEFHVRSAFVHFEEWWTASGVWFTDALMRGDSQVRLYGYDWNGFWGGVPFVTADQTICMSRYLTIKINKTPIIEVDPIQLDQLNVHQLVDNIRRMEAELQERDNQIAIMRTTICGFQDRDDEIDRLRMEVAELGKRNKELDNHLEYQKQISQDQLEIIQNLLNEIGSIKQSVTRVSDEDAYEELQYQMDGRTRELMEANSWMDDCVKNYYSNRATGKNIVEHGDTSLSAKENDVDLEMGPVLPTADDANTQQEEDIIQSFWESLGRKEDSETTNLPKVKLVRNQRIQDENHDVSKPTKELVDINGNNIQYPLPQYDFPSAEVMRMEMIRSRQRVPFCHFVTKLAFNLSVSHIIECLKNSNCVFTEISVIDLDNPHRSWEVLLLGCEKMIIDIYQNFGIPEFIIQADLTTFSSRNSFDIFRSIEEAFKKIGPIGTMFDLPPGDPAIF
jgi:hypothetical protein